MIPQKDNKQIKTNIGNDGGSVEFIVDDMSHIAEIMQKHIYSNKAESIMREIVSNAIDANVESGSKEAVLITFPTKLNEGKLTIKDFGIGMDETRIDIFRRFCASTKRDSNKAVGCFGIGCKSPLALSDSFFVLTRTKEFEYKYIIYKTEFNFVPKINLLYKKENTTGITGTEISMQINDNHEIEKMIKYGILMMVVNPSNIQHVDDEGVITDCLDIGDKCSERLPYKFGFNPKYMVYNMSKLSNYISRKSHLMTKRSIRFYINSNVILLNGTIPYVHDENVYVEDYFRDRLIMLKCDIGTLSLSANREKISDTFKLSKIIQKIKYDTKQCCKRIDDYYEENFDKSYIADLKFNPTNNKRYHERNHVLKYHLHSIYGIQDNECKKISALIIGQLLCSDVIYVINEGKSPKVNFIDYMAYIMAKHNKTFVVILRPSILKLKGDFKNYLRCTYLRNYIPPIKKKERKERPNINYDNYLFYNVFNNTVYWNGNGKQHYTVKEINENPDNFRILISKHSSIEDRTTYDETYNLRREGYMLLNKSNKEIKFIKCPITKRNLIKNVEILKNPESFAIVPHQKIEDYIRGCNAITFKYVFRHVINRRHRDSFAVKLIRDKNESNLVFYYTKNSLPEIVMKHANKQQLQFIKVMTNRFYQESIKMRNLLKKKRHMAIAIFGKETFKHTFYANLVTKDIASEFILDY